MIQAARHYISWKLHQPNQISSIYMCSVGDRTGKWRVWNRFGWITWSLCCCHFIPTPMDTRIENDHGRNTHLYIHRRPEYKAALRFAAFLMCLTAKLSKPWDFQKSRPWTSQEPSYTVHNDELKQNQLFSPKKTWMSPNCVAAWLHCSLTANLCSDCQLKNLQTTRWSSLSGPLVTVFTLLC